MAPFYSFVNNLIGLKDTIGQILESFGFNRKIPRSRNRDFERAGKEEPTRALVDPISAANIRNAQKVRSDETIRAAVQENKLLKSRGKSSEEFRKQKGEEKASVSQGNVISHLARMQQKAKKKAKLEQDNESNDDIDAPTGHESADENGENS